MTKIGWIIAAVVVVGVGIAAGILLSGGREPGVIAAESGSGASSESVAVVASPEATASSDIGSDQVGVSENVPANVPEVVVPVVAAERTEDDEPIMIASLDDLFANAAAYSNKEIIARGTIVTQCISGCTFSLEDGTGVVAVELVDDALDHVLDGGSVGRQVEVRGVVETSPQLVIVLEEPEDWKYVD